MFFYNHFSVQHTTFCHKDFFKSLSLFQVLTDIFKDHSLLTTVYDGRQIASKGYLDHPQSHPPCTYFFSCKSRPSKADSYCILFFCDDVAKQLGKCTVGYSSCYGTNSQVSTKFSFCKFSKQAFYLLVRKLTHFYIIQKVRHFSVIELVNNKCHTTQQGAIDCCCWCSAHDIKMHVTM